MGYTTYFDGVIDLDPALNKEEIDYLLKFKETRRMHRGNGPYYIEGTGSFGQGQDPDVINFNQPDPSQPGLWCQWEPNDTGTGIVWDQGEKFCDAAEWMKYLIDHFLCKDPIAKQLYPATFKFLQGHKCDGEIEAAGEEPYDLWKIQVKNNLVYTLSGRLVYKNKELVV